MWSTYFPSEVQRDYFILCANSLLFACGVSGVPRLVYKIVKASMQPSRGKVVGRCCSRIISLFIVMPSSPEQRTQPRVETTQLILILWQDKLRTFFFLKNQLYEKVENLSSGLVPQTATEMQKLSRGAEAEKLKFAGSSKLCGTLDKVSNSFQAIRTIKRREEGC